MDRLACLGCPDHFWPAAAPAFTGCGMRPKLSGLCRWQNTAVNLQLDVKLDWDCMPGVTPQIMATHVSLQLGRWLESRFQTCCWHGLLLDIGDRQVPTATPLLLNVSLVKVN